MIKFSYLSIFFGRKVNVIDILEGKTKKRPVIYKKIKNKWIFLGKNRFLTNWFSFLVLHNNE